jgi:tetratricopeptide (TPR) repeat protein
MLRESPKVLSSRAREQVEAALKAIESEAASLPEKVDMLVEMGMNLQSRPKTPDDLLAAAHLYEKALELLGPEFYLERARISARLGTAWQAMPGDTDEYLIKARDIYESVRRTFSEHGNSGETAELEMNLGLVLQSLAGLGKAPITEAISAYQRSLRIFDAATYPQEFAILQNNLATAFLSIPFTDERAKMREALAVQCFEEGLKAVNLIDHPTEYAMLQNNLGNALQYASSSHAVENNIRALAAYDEALKVRTKATTPLEYANTIANKANCLCNLPDDLENPEAGNPRNLASARGYYEEAGRIFAERGEIERSRIVFEAAAEIASNLEGVGMTRVSNGSGAHSAQNVGDVG